MMLVDVLEAAGSVARFRAGIDLSGYRADERRHSRTMPVRATDLILSEPQE
jgi:hypothetical protein